MAGSEKQFARWQDPRIREERLAGIRAYRERTKKAIALLDAVEAGTIVIVAGEKPINDDQ
jgi:hypothetical protein